MTNGLCEKFRKAIRMLSGKNTALTTKQPTQNSQLKKAFEDANIPPKVKIRFTRSEDVEKVMAYYEANPADGYAPREMTPDQIAQGQAIIAEDEGGQIWGASVTYEYRIPDRQGHDQQCWSEAGTTRITLNGCNLLLFFFASQALYEEFTNPPRHFIYADAHQNNEAMNYMMQNKVKWTLIPQPEDLHEVCQATLADDKKGIPVNYYICGQDELPLQAHVVLSVIEKGGFDHKSGLKVEVDFSEFPLALEHKKRLVELASNHRGAGPHLQNKEALQKNGPGGLRKLPTCPENV